MTQLHKIYIDSRWEGMGGIGRFATQVQARLDNCVPASVIGSPASMVNPFTLSWMSFVCRHGVLFLPGYIPPFFSFGDFVFTIHDLNHLDRRTSLAKRLFYHVFVKSGCRRAKKVLTVSEFSKRRIMEWSGLAPDKVINVGNGVDARFHPGVAPFNAGYPYLLCVSVRKEHKNEPRLLSAFAHAAISPAFRLVFTGPPSDELQTLAASLGVSERLVFMGTISDADLPSLYRGAVALTFPSNYEGFGLPVIEAMACGVPVITSTTTSLPEIAGSAGLLVNPDDEEEIQRAIERVVTDPDLRERMSAAGLEQARKFTWEATVGKIKTALMFSRARA